MSSLATASALGFRIKRRYAAAALFASLLVLDGQSNMLGAGYLSDFNGTGNALDTLRPVITRQFERVFILNPSTLVFERLQAGVTNLAYGAAIGPEIGIAQRWEQENPAGNLYIVKNSRAGRPISDWERGQPGYTDLSHLIVAGTSQLVAAGLVPVVRGFLWSQGESNAQDTDYASKLQTFTDNLFADKLLTGATKVGIYKMRGGGAVAPQQQLYVDRNPAYARAIETAHYRVNGDGLHYNAHAQFLSGYTDGYNAVYGLHTPYPFPM